MILTMFLTIPRHEKQRDECTNENFVVCNKGMKKIILKIILVGLKSPISQTLFPYNSVLRHVREFPLGSRRPWDQIILLRLESF